MRNYVIALYIRLSVEDFKTESLSIPNQKLILHEKAMSLPEWDNSEILEFIDNGHTGTNFERPAVQELLTMVQAGKINCIIVKDLSRFGRNSIETGYFIERVFPLYHTRFISVSDDFDTANFKGDTGGIDIAFNASIKRFSLSNKKLRDYLLRGKVFCGCCDHAMSLRNGAWFYCRHSEVAETLPCHGVRIKMADLEQVVFETIRAQMCPALGIDSNKPRCCLSFSVEYVD